MGAEDLKEYRNESDAKYMYLRVLLCRSYQRARLRRAEQSISVFNPGTRIKGSSDLRV